jgi:hypothetical protein
VVGKVTVADDEIGLAVCIKAICAWEDRVSATLFSMADNEAGLEIGAHKKNCTWCVEHDIDAATRARVFRTQLTVVVGLRACWHALRSSSLLLARFVGAHDAGPVVGGGVVDWCFVGDG